MVDRQFLAVHLQIHHGIYAKVKHSELFQILKDDAIKVLHPQTVAHLDPLSMEFSKQEYWSGLPSLPPGDLRDIRTKPVSLASPALADVFFATVPPGKPK